MTKIVRVDNLDGNQYGTPEPLSEDYLKQIENADVDIALYSYQNAGYEGGGDLVCLKDGKWYHFSLSHCSCNGPLDDFYFANKAGYDSLVDLLEVFSEEYRSTIYFLISSAEASLDLDT